GAGGACLPEEALAKRDVARALGLEQLEGDGLSRDDVRRGPDHPHAALADLAIELESAGDDGARNEISHPAPHYTRAGEAAQVAPRARVLVRPGRRPGLWPLGQPHE